MKRYINFIGLGFCLLFPAEMLFSQEHGTKKPEIYLALREFESSEFDWYSILMKALLPWMTESVKDPIKKGLFNDSRIFIYEEKEHWVVMIFDAGNGRTKTSEDDTFYTADTWDKRVGNGNNVIFLDKKTLEIVSAPQGDIIKYLPYADSYILPEKSRSEFKP